MARRVFLHCGTAKSGTTFLQDLWWRHRGELRQRGLLLPGTALRDHFHAAALVKGMDVIVEDLAPAEREVWRRLVEETRHWSGDVLISHEHFSDSSAEAAAAALADLAGAADEVHLVVTVRDLGRVLPSAWQQRVKQGARQPYGKFLGTVRRGRDDQKFWRYQDVPGILERWAAGLPPQRVHLVVVPPPGAPRDELPASRRDRLVRREVSRKPGHPVLVRRVLDPPVKDTFRVALLETFRVVAFAPGTGPVTEPGCRHVPGGTPTGRARRVRVQEVGLQRGGPGPVKGGGFVGHDPGMLPGDGPGLQGGQGQRQCIGQGVGNPQERTRRPVTDRQGTRNLCRDRHLLGLDRSIRRSHRAGNIRVLHGC